MYKPAPKDEVDEFIATMKPAESESSQEDSDSYEDYWDSYEVKISCRNVCKCKTYITAML